MKELLATLYTLAIYFGITVIFALTMPLQDGGTMRVLMFGNLVATTLIVYYTYRYFTKRDVKFWGTALLTIIIANVLHYIAVFDSEFSLSHGLLIIFTAVILYSKEE